MRVLVVGAGVVGVSSAWYLARDGHAVTVVDRHEAPACETSHANGGQISVSHAEPWANPHTPLVALRWLLRDDAPLLIRPRADGELAAWLIRFLRECLPGRTRRNIEAILALALYSRQQLKALRHELAADGGFDYGQRERGILHVYTDPGEFARAQRAAALMRELGCARNPVSVAEAVAIEPALADCASQLAGADFTAEDESGDAMRFTRALADRCTRAGVAFRFDTTVSALQANAGGVQAKLAGSETLEADIAVVAGGVSTRRLLAPFGCAVPIYPAKGYSATIPLSPGSIAPEVSLTDDEAKLVFSRLGDSLRVAGTAEFSGYDTGLNPVRCEALMRRTRLLFPRLAAAGPPAYWAGLRPATPSNVPLIGRVASTRGTHGRIWINSGHGTLGWTMACGSAAALTDLIGGREPAPRFPFRR
jgi:D-amino-acid dehydrogenase